MGGPCIVQTEKSLKGNTQKCLYVIVPEKNEKLVKMFFSSFFVVQLLSHVQLCSPACQVPLSFTISQSVLRFTSIKLVMYLFHPLPPASPLPSIFPSINIFSNELALQVAKVLELQHQSFQ